MAEPFWTNPQSIKFKISPISDLHGTKGGDWDFVRRHDFLRATKTRAIRERFIEGKRWEETELFRDLYRRRFKREQQVRGAHSLEELVAQYYDRVDGLYHGMRRDGFQLVESLPTFYIGRQGEVFIGNQGNHRLAIAQVLGLQRIAGEIKCRHRQST